MCAGQLGDAPLPKSAEKATRSLVALPYSVHPCKSSFQSPAVENTSGTLYRLCLFIDENLPNLAAAHILGRVFVCQHCPAGKKTHPFHPGRVLDRCKKVRVCELFCVLSYVNVLVSILGPPGTI